MFRVDDVFDEAKKIFGACDDGQLFKWLGDAVSLICNKADLEGWKGYLDICTTGCHCEGSSPCNSPRGCGRLCVTLPREVQTVIGVNIAGRPALGFDQLFEFHLNGPGSKDHKTCDWTWADQGHFHSTYRDLVFPAKLISYLQLPDDNGKRFIVYGFDTAGQVLRRFENGQWLNGYLVPTIYGYAIPEASAPLIARITGVFKERSAGSMRLSTVDDSGTTGTLLGVYEPDETLPQYRRIKLNRACNWVRIAYLKNNPIFTSRYDHIELSSRIGFLLAMQARKMYKDLRTDEAHSFEADAARLEQEAQWKMDPPTYMPPQVNDMNNIRDKADYDIR